jgi:CubicO group peptidase (beta-lactamase class C family)
MHNVSSRILLLAAALVVCLSSCRESRSPLQSSGPYQYRVPPQTNDGWKTGSVAEVGINSKTLVALIEDIRRRAYDDIHSILIVKDNILVFEEYFGGYKYDWWGEDFRGQYTEFDINTLHNVHSVTKSITSSLIGIATDRGFIGGVDETLFSFFPRYSHLNDGTKDGITLAHLLTMTSGLQWNENDVPANDTQNDVIQLFIVEDPVGYILSKRVVSVPGTDWYYNSGGVNLLGEVIRKATGMRIDDFSQQHLFAPLGITDYRWGQITPEMVCAHGELKLRPRDIAKFGCLYLNKGVWNGRRIASESWVEASTTERCTLPDSVGYGYLWWRRTYNVNSSTIVSYHALGWGGQRSILFPELDMTVVLTGGYYIAAPPVSEIVTRYLLPALDEAPDNCRTGR